MKRCVDVVPLLGPLLDSALAEDDAAWVQDHLAGCASCRDRKALLAAQADALREKLAARAAAADFTGFAERVMARIQQETPPPPLERAQVWGREMWGAHKGAFAAAGGLAVAACMALAVLFTPPSAPFDDAETLLADASAPQVEEVDFGTHDGAVLQLTRETTVIWMFDDRVGVQQ
jgi:anti-sigma factor RsiW